MAADATKVFGAAAAGGAASQLVQVLLGLSSPAPLSRLSCAGAAGDALAAPAAGSAEAAGDLAEAEEEQGMLSAAFLLLVTCAALFVALTLAREAARYRDRGVAVMGSFRQYLSYRFGYWYTWTPGSAGIVLLSLSVFLLVAGGLLLHFVQRQPIAECLWSAWVWIAAPDGGGSAETVGGRAVGLVTSVGGMLIFALLMSVISSMFEDVLQGLREGRLPVIEGNHYVILGYVNPVLKVIVEELCEAAETNGGMVIAIMTPMPKPEVEDYLRDADIDFRNSTVLVRSGDPHHTEDLRNVATESASRVLVLSKPGVSREDSDANTLNVLLTLRNNGWPSRGRCIIQCELPSNRCLFEQLANEGSQVLCTGGFVGALMVQCSRQRGMITVVRSLFSFEGDEFYVEFVKGTAGRTFLDVLLALPQVVLLGVKAPERELELLPPMDYVFNGDERLVMIAEDVSTLPAEVGHRTPAISLPQLTDAIGKGKVSRLAADEVEAHRTTTTVIIGWNEMIGSVVKELDSVAGPGSKVIIHSPTPASERQAVLQSTLKRAGYQYKNITVVHTEGTLGSRFALEELPLHKASRVLVLADSCAASPYDADLQTMAVIIQVQDILKNRQHDGSGSGRNGHANELPEIMPQLLDLTSEESCIKSGISEYIMTERLAARIVSMVSVVPGVTGIISEISKEGGKHLRIRDLAAYPAAGILRVAGEFTFDEVSAVVALSGEVALGWAQEAADASEEPCEGSWELNPKDRAKKRSWSQDMKVVVLCGAHLPKERSSLFSFGAKSGGSPCAAGLSSAPATLRSPAVESGTAAAAET